MHAMFFLIFTFDSWGSRVGGVSGKPEEDRNPVSELQGLENKPTSMGSQEKRRTRRRHVGREAGRLAAGLAASPRILLFKFNFRIGKIKFENKTSMSYIVQKSRHARRYTLEVSTPLAPPPAQGPLAPRPPPTARDVWSPLSGFCHFL